MREFTLLYAPNISSYKRFQPGSFAPTAVQWGVDNRTCALRLVGHGLSLRVENRVPGGDVNPYLAVAGMIAAGRVRHRQRTAADARADRQCVHLGRGERPHHAPRGVDLWEKSELARTVFGEDVHAHYANAARVELAAFEAAVTDWEMYRGFERM
ncbi:hypothetical protein ACU686_17725 [Yinghuangia aomiensis]